jgi:alcohol dehydrogenase (cytochrome c)
MIPHLSRTRRAVLLILTLVLLVAGSLYAQLSFERIINANKEPQNWLTYGGTLSNQRYSLLNQITTDNVKNLELQWVLQVRSMDGITKFEATPLVVDGIMYTVKPPSPNYEVVALDAATGRIFWTYTYAPSQARTCCGRNSKGLAIHGETLFLATIDAHLIAIDSKTGREIWNTKVETPPTGDGIDYSFTVAPQIAKDKVILGPAGGEYGIRGFLAAFDVKTGDEKWRFHVIPEPGEPGNETWGANSWEHGGGSIWTPGSYDPELNLVYWGTGNPGPDWNGDPRPGDNLYSCSVVALDADTGKLKWHYQFSPHDEFDYDSTQVPVLADIQWQGRLRKVMLFANRNGIFYVLDRATGEFLLGKPFVKVTWMDGFDAKGRPHRAVESSTTGVLVYPGNQGGTNWYNPAFNPRTGLFYVPTWEDTSSTFTKREQEFKPGQTFGAGNPTVPVGLTTQNQYTRTEEEGYYGAIRALDPKTGDTKWIFKLSQVTDGGVLTTATDLVFAGGREGYFFALDGRDGKLLWKAMLGGQVAAGPISYAVAGKQYVAVAAGNGLFAFALR